MVNSAFYTEMQKVTSNVLGEFDQGGLQYVEMVPGNGPVNNPGPPTPVPYPIVGAARGVKFKYIDGTQIQAGDMQCVMAVRDDVTPDEKGFVMVGEKRYKVVKAQPIPATGVTVAYRLFFRG